MKPLAILLLALFLLGASACPTEPEDTIGAPPAFPEVPEPEDVGINNMGR